MDSPYPYDGPPPSTHAERDRFNAWNQLSNSHTLFDLQRMDRLQGGLARFAFEESNLQNLNDGMNLRERQHSQDMLESTRCIEGVNANNFQELINNMSYSDSKNLEYYENGCPCNDCMSIRDVLGVDIYYPPNNWLPS